MSTSTVPNAGDYGFGKEELRKSSRASSPRKVDSGGFDQPSLKAQRKVVTTEPSNVESQAVSHRRS
jgi:hypothetical protein